MATLTSDKNGETPNEAIPVADGEFPMYEKDPAEALDAETGKDDEALKLVKIAQGDGAKLDSDTVDGIHAYVKPTPNALLPLDKDGKVPLSVLPAPVVPPASYPGITVFTDATGARTSGVNYQNTNTVPLYVAVSVNINASQDLRAFTDAAAVPTTWVASAGAPGGANATFQIFYVVLPNHYYRTTWVGTLNSFIEWY